MDLKCNSTARDSPDFNTPEPNATCVECVTAVTKELYADGITDCHADAKAFTMKECAHEFPASYVKNLDSYRSKRDKSELRRGN